MKPLTAKDLFTLEQYAINRLEFRARVLAHKRDRQVPIGPNATLYFEDALTIQYQVQEMLRVERVFEPEGIREELDSYNPLIPDGSNLKATFMLEYPDIEERRQALAKLMNIAERVWLKVDDCEVVRPVADEDIERETEDKTSSVHFLRFELLPDMVRALKSGAPLAIGIDHPNYRYQVDVPENVRRSLAGDLD
jgi:hypothetical protein